MDIDTADMGEADDIADHWVSLAREQYEYGSQLVADGNRSLVREEICRHIVVGGLFVARSSESEGSVDSGNDERDSAIVGFVMFAPDSGRYEQTTSVGVVESLYVVPDRRGEGIGSELLAAAEEALRADGADVIRLDVMAANEAARRFYARHGYGDHRVTMTKHESDMHSKEE